MSLQYQRKSTPAVLWRTFTRSKGAIWPISIFIASAMSFKRTTFKQPQGGQGMQDTTWNSFTTAKPTGTANCVKAIIPDTPWGASPGCVHKYELPTILFAQALGQNHLCLTPSSDRGSRMLLPARRLGPSPGNITVDGAQRETV